jgi:transposase-like protein
MKAEAKKKLDNFNIHKFHKEFRNIKSEVEQLVMSFRKIARLLQVPNQVVIQWCKEFTQENYES